MILVDLDFMNTFPMPGQGCGGKVSDSSKIDDSEVGVLCLIEAVHRNVLGTSFGKLNVKISQPFGVPFQAFEKQQLRSTHPSYQSQIME